MAALLVIPVLQGAFPQVLAAIPADQFAEALRDWGVAAGGVRATLLQKGQAHRFFAAVCELFAGRATTAAPAAPAVGQSGPRRASALALAEVLQDNLASRRPARCVLFFIILLL